MRHLYLLLALAMIAPAAPRAQDEAPLFLEDTVQLDVDEANQVIRRQSAQPYSRLELDEETIEKLEGAESSLEPGEQISVVTGSRPVLSPGGEPLVGRVAHRYLTREQLTHRVNRLLEHLATPDEILARRTGMQVDPTARLKREATEMGVSVEEARRLEEEERRILLEERVLADWAEVATLAVHAEAAARQMPELAVTEAEIDAAIEKLKQSSAPGPAGQGQAAAAGTPNILYSERELRQEVRDGLQIDKFMHEYVRRMYPGQALDQRLQAIFLSNPLDFIEPTRVHAWQIVYPLAGNETRDTRQKIEKELSGGLFGGGLRAQLRRCRTPEDFAAMAAGLRESGSEAIMTEKGWVNFNDQLDVDIHKELFALSPGQVSEPIHTRLGYFLLMVTERVEGEKPDFERARPRLIEYMIGLLREPLHEQIRGLYDIRLAASGLREYIVAGPAPETAPAPPTARVEAASPEAKAELAPLGRTGAAGSRVVRPAAPPRGADGRRLFRDVPPVGRPAPPPVRR